MKTLAYLRVSKDEQDTQNQRLAILEFARKEKIHVDRFISTTVSSRKSTQERKIDQLLRELETKDTLIVSELSRMGRSVGEIITTLDTLVGRNIHFLSVKEGIRLGSQADLQTKVLVTMFLREVLPPTRRALFADIERELISMRTKEGLAAARAKGKKLGRPKGRKGKSRLDGRESEICLLLTKNVSNASIAKITEVDRSTLYHFIQSRGIQKKS